MNESTLLRVEELSVAFATDQGDALAVDRVSFTLAEREVLCLVGESGCGKSATALSLLRLLPSPPAFIRGGRVLFEGQDLATIPESRLREVRGNRVGMIFQEPMTSLNPVFRIGDQVGEPLRLHQGLSKREARQRAVRLLDQVGIPDPAARIMDFPHQLSGGMRQRVMIAMAMACEPHLIIADEPTTALDVTVQKQVLDLLVGLTRDRGNGLLLITHDLGVVRTLADRVAVMYLGRVVEEGPAGELFTHPSHPYTQGLIRSRPSLDPLGRHGRLPIIPGTVPGLMNRPAGCAFRDRCPEAHERCLDDPPMVDLGGGHRSRCWLAAGQ